MAFGGLDGLPGGGQVAAAAESRALIISALCYSLVGGFLLRSLTGNRVSLLKRDVKAVRQGRDDLKRDVKAVRRGGTEVTSRSICGASCVRFRSRQLAKCGHVFIHVYKISKK